jgi:KDO2-lipid IV(A) lauroyltransferase
VNRKRLRHALEFAFYRVLSGALMTLPEGVALRSGGCVGWMFGTVMRLRRAHAEAHLRIAFPGESPAWRRRVARASYTHLGREAAALFRLAGMDRGAVLARTEAVGFEDLVAAIAAGKGAVVVTGHLGNWEIGGAYVAARGLAVEAVAKAMANRLFDADLKATRERLGIHLMDPASARRGVPAALRAGRVVAIVADQNAGENGIFVPFFGKPASTARGPAVFALRCEAPLFLGVCVRMPGWPQRYRLSLERIEAAPTGDPVADARRLTELHTAALERAVRAAPEQYFWQHRRWKTRPPQEPLLEPPV